MIKMKTNEDKLITNDNLIESVPSNSNTNSNTNNRSNNDKPPRFKPSRKFLGNTKYLQFYNQFVQEFFTKCPKFSDLTSSIITTNGEIYNLPKRKKHNSRGRPRKNQNQNPQQNDFLNDDDDGNDIGGTLWTWQEKEIFFNLLNKYKTITAILNNQQDWLAFLPKKSMIQIITYYELLKNNYKTLQRQQQKQQQQQKQRQRQRQKRYRKNKKGKSKKRHGDGDGDGESSLLSYRDIPIAYEMSPYFQNFEQLQSDLITKRENNKLLTHVNKNKIFRQYKSLMKQINENDNQEIIEESESTTTTPTNIVSMNKDSIIDMIKLQEIFKCQISIDSLILFEKLSLLLIKKILLNLILFITPKENSEGIIMVKQSDIWKAIEKLNYNPRKTLQFFKILRRDTIRSRRDTKNEENTDQEEEEEQQQQQIEDVSGYISPFDNPIIHSGKHKKRHLKNNDSISNSSNKEITIDAIIKRQQNNISSNDNNNNNSNNNSNNAQKKEDEEELEDINKQNNDHDHDQYLEQYLNILETKNLNEFDYINSKMYERGLVEMLMPEKKDDDDDGKEFIEQDETIAEYWIYENQNIKGGEEEEEEEGLPIESDSEEEEGEVIDAEAEAEAELSEIQEQAQEQEETLNETNYQDEELLYIDPELFDSDYMNNNNNNNNKSTDNLSSDLVVKPSSTQSIDKEVLPNKDTKTKDKHTLITIIGGEDEIEQMTISQLKKLLPIPRKSKSSDTTSTSTSTSSGSGGITKKYSNKSITKKLNKLNQQFAQY
ncbi:hypothetical protein MG7_05090 [Candida albicans P34048]|nr:hypothetical protein MG7_05090 [Candida albicans P34048]